jgi:hypothetical protein
MKKLYKIDESLILISGVIATIWIRSIRFHRKEAPAPIRRFRNREVAPEVTITDLAVSPICIAS